MTKPIYPSTNDDRSMMYEHVKEGNILDIGCADGELLLNIKGEDNRLYGVDIVERELDPRINFFCGTIETFLMQNVIKFDTILMSASLHEIYSYGDLTNKEIFFNGVMETLRHHLAEDGVIIIRDGILHAEYNVAVEHHGLGITNISLMEYANYHNIPFTFNDQKKFTMSQQHAYEFLMTYVWRSASDEIFFREMGETFGVFNHHMCRKLKNFKMISHMVYLRKSYLEYFDKFMDSDHLPFPYTHQIVVLKNDA